MVASTSSVSVLKAGKGGAPWAKKKSPGGFSKGLCNNLPQGAPVTTYAAGGEMTIIMPVHAEHGGEHEFRLCPKSWNTLSGGRAQAECIDTYLIHRECAPGCGCASDSCKSSTGHRSPSDPIFSHGSPTQGSDGGALIHGAHTFTFKLPAGVTCDKCT